MGCLKGRRGADKEVRRLAQWREEVPIPLAGKGQLCPPCWHAPAQISVLITPGLRHFLLVTSRLSRRTGGGWLLLGYLADHTKEENTSS